MKRKRNSGWMRLGWVVLCAAIANCSTSATLGIEQTSSISTGEAGSDAPIESLPDASTPEGAAPVKIPAFCAQYPRPLPIGGWESTAVFYGSNGKLEYASDADGNRIPDFSYAGYGSGAAIPSVPELVYVEGNGGDVDNTFDDTPRIQAAIDAVAQRPLGASGFRGAVVLGAGLYRIAGIIKLNRDGIVLRGVGHRGDWSTDTVLLAVGGSQSPRIVLGSGVDNGWSDEVPGSRTNIVTPFVSVGARAFEVADASGLGAGDNVIVVHPVTNAWLTAVHWGDTGSDPPWTVDVGPITYNRRVVAKSGNRITLDAPIFNHLDGRLTQSFVFKTYRTNIVSHVGIENLMVDTEYSLQNVESHPLDAIDIIGAEDSFIRDTSTYRFVYAGVRIQNGVRITLSNVEARQPLALRSAGRMVNFALDVRAQLVLFSGCRAEGGRHHFEANGPLSSSGDVFHRSTSEALEYEESSGGLRLFSQGLLYDNVEEIGQGKAQLGCVAEVGLPAAHGWAAVHSVLWNYHFDRSLGSVEKPPTGQNYAIGAGPFSSPIGTCSNVVPGFIEQNEGPLRQESLYEAQLCDRLQR
ncbi:MAG TPA: hypothetical protein VF881_15970 [Polyangiaceae bacterium]